MTEEIALDSMYHLESSDLGPLSIAANLYGVEKNAFASAALIDKIKNFFAEGMAVQVEFKGLDANSDLQVVLFQNKISLNDALVKQGLLELREEQPDLTSNAFIEELISSSSFEEIETDSDSVGALCRSGIDTSEIYRVLITHFDEGLIREGEISIHLRNAESRATYEMLLERMRMFFEAEKERLRESEVEIEQDDFVMFVIKGPICLRGKVVQVLDHVNLLLHAIDVGFEMKVRRKNCFKLEEDFFAVPILSYPAKLVGIDANNHHADIIIEHLRTLKSKCTEMECQFQNEFETYRVVIPSLSDHLVRQGLRSCFYN